MEIPWKFILLLIILFIIPWILGFGNIGAIIVFIILLFYLLYRYHVDIKNQRKIRINKFNEEDLESVKMQMEYYKITDSRLQQRENYILVAESMLLFSIVTALTSLPPNYIISRAIAIGGIIITYLWYLANLRLLIQSDILLQDYLFKDFIKRSITAVKQQPSGKLILHDILPSSILILWIYLLHYSYDQIDVYDFAIESFPYFLLGLLVLRLFVGVSLPRK